MKNIFAFIFVALFCIQIFDAKCNNNSPRGVQIVTRKNNVLQLRLEDMQSVLNSDAIKDRYAVIVSIAGAFRKGKSFLMNIFIKYLDANYKRHHLPDWLGEETHDGSIKGGFSWRGGRKPETMGIWMWSEVYTFDSENGDKLAIILIDTQGIFDDKTSIRDCTAIFAITTMLSSVQCFNVMQNIQEDHLQQLEFFAEYGRIAQDHESETPFQKLIFIVRDWPYSHETNYGDGQAVIDKTLTPNDEQTLEMRALRRRIKSSFESIGAYLLPHPGRIVAEGNRFTGDVRQIHPEFRKYVKELVISLVSPKNLIVKRINGRKIRVGDLAQYFQTYLDTFKGDSMPRPKTLFQANIDASNSILLQVWLNYYTQTMEKFLESRRPSRTELIDFHSRTKSVAITQFLAKPKLGSDDHVAGLKTKLEQNIEQTYHRIQGENLQKERLYNERNTDISESGTYLAPALFGAGVSGMAALILSSLVGTLMRLLFQLLGYIFV